MKTYLICPHCNHPNEIRTPYLTFCANCSKKIDNNFSEWSGKHPEFSFEDFKRIVGVTGLLSWEREKLPVEQRKWPTGRSAIVVSTIAALSVVILWSVLFQPISSTDLPSWTSVNWSENAEDLSSWQTITVPKDNFEVRMPSKPVVEKSLEESDLGILEFSKYTAQLKHENNEPHIYSISLLRYPLEIINSRAISEVQSRDFLDYSMKQLLQQETWNIIYQKKIVYGLYPGREIMMSNVSTHSESRLRMYLIENVLYTMQVQLATSSGSIRSAEKFLNSFKLLTYADAHP